MREDPSSPDLNKFRSFTVPVILDSMGGGATWPQLARCVYFVISIDEPDTPFFLHMGNVQIPFLMLGLQGIIYQPVQPGMESFVSPKLWSELIEEIEHRDGFSVDFEYFWVPVELLNRARAASPFGEKSSEVVAQRGDVFRLRDPLFLEAWRAAQDGTDFVRYAALAMDNYGGDRLAAGLTYSPEETDSLRIWAIDEFAKAKIG